MQEQFNKYIGQNTHISSTEMADEYLHLAMMDLFAAEILSSQELYNQSVYMYIQSMEKKIKSSICQKINVALPFYADKLREIGHSLDKSILFLIEILSSNDSNLKSQLEKQLLIGVFENIRFLGLYNNCRYPKYNSKFGNYSILKISKNDCERMKNIATKLDRFLADFYKL